jgi:hypothetical protein
MAITVYQIEDKLFTIHPPEELTMQLAEFLKNEVQCTITNAYTQFLGHNSGTGAKPDNGALKQGGYIEGRINNAGQTVRDIVGLVAVHLDYKIESDSLNRLEWTLYSKEEAEYYEHYGI